MAHFAKIENGIVTQVIVTMDLDEDTFADRMLIERNEIWIQTSYNNNIRYNYAGIGFTYDPVDDAFIAPVPCEHDELLLNELKQWECSHSSHVIIYDEL
jgi:hypothetical protein